VPKLGLKSKVAIGIFVALLLMIIGGLFFPAPRPDIHLSANYGGESPDPFYRLGPIYITNTLIASWISIVVLIGLCYFATRKMKLVPRGLQNFLEAAVEMLLDFIEGVAGKENGRRFFPVIATIFLFVLMNAWMGLLPIFNVIGTGHTGTSETLFWGDYSGFIVDTALLRPANTDINIPLMLALVSFIFVEYCGITSIGFRHYVSRFFRYGQLLRGLGQLIRGRIKSAAGVFFYGAIDVFVGALELISEFVRIISFTFRLFGNMTAGEILLLMMAFLIPVVVAVPFYGLEIILGFVQALIFAGLTLIFATVAVTPHESHD
jgi:F-type H+-transporting ATPase subunit a